MFLFQFHFVFFSAPENDEQLTQEAEWSFGKFTTKSMSQQETLLDQGFFLQTNFEVNFSKIYSASLVSSSSLSGALKNQN